MSTTSLPKTERGLLVAAVRQLLADGWHRDEADESDSATAIYHHDLQLRIADWGGWVTVEHCDDDGTPRDVVAGFEGNSFPQAISHLVVEGILPRTFAFWAPPLPSKPMHVPADCPLCSGDLVSVTE